MAEFVDVLRQFYRMCKANKANAGCLNCPLHKPDGVSDECSISAFVNNPERIEREVMKWAAEHPEPVYPNWCQWLVSIGVIPKEIDNSQYRTIIELGLIKPIHADIAEKLGIEPKKG